MVVVWHCTSPQRHDMYLRTGTILPPVRAWLNILDAESFCKRTGETIIIRLKFDEYKMKKLDGHGNKAVYYNEPYPINWLNKRTVEEGEVKSIVKGFGEKE